MRNTPPLTFTLLTAGVCALGGCGTREGVSTQSRTPASVPCLQAFAPPAGADLLCDEHVMGNGAEIHWQSFGSTEARSTLNDRFRRSFSSCGGGGGGIVFKPPAFDASLGNRRFETYEATSTAYPACATKTQPKHRTVIILSEKLDRPGP